MRSRICDFKALPLLSKEVAYAQLITRREMSIVLSFRQFAAESKPGLSTL
jgi:hypothetical protein